MLFTSLSRHVICANKPQHICKYLLQFRDSCVQVCTGGINQVKCIELICIRWKNDLERTVSRLTAAALPAPEEQRGGCCSLLLSVILALRLWYAD